MDAPKSFVINVAFKHHRPEYVRAIAKANGFFQVAEERRENRRRRSEIWAKPEAIGWWLIRLDGQGHGIRYFGTRPHYHKEWVETDPEFTDYVSRYSATASCYADDGSLVEVTGDLRAKLIHIPR